MPPSTTPLSDDVEDEAVPLAWVDAVVICVIVTALVTVVRSGSLSVLSGNEDDAYSLVFGCSFGEDN